MSELKHFVICENDCKIEGMTKEQIVAAIAEATGNTPTLAGDAFITQVVNQNGGNIKLWQGTAAQYNALTEKAADTVYIVNDNVLYLDPVQATAEAAAELAQETADKMAGCWISFTDAQGNPTTEPYIHWLTEEA